MNRVMRVRATYVPQLVVPLPQLRVGLVDETIDSLSAAFGEDEYYGDLGSTGDLDAWSMEFEITDPGSDDPAVVEEQAKKPSATKKPPTAAGVAAARQLQTALKTLGYDIGPTGVDGKIGPRTKAAIVKFKKDQGISPADGTVTPALRAALDAAVKKKAAAPVAMASGSGGTGLLIAVGAAVLAIAAYVFLKR